MLKANGRSKFPSRNLGLLQEVEFENQLDNQAWGITNFLIKLKKLEEIILVF
jgi:hypothetical protein